MKSRLLWFVLLVFSLCWSAALFAQDTASITGTVTDPSGAAIPAAQVTLISAERGINRTTATNGSGDYELGPSTPGLLPRVLPCLDRPPGRADTGFQRK